MKIYLAAPLFTDTQRSIVSMLKGMAESHDHKVFSPYHNSADIFKGRAPADCTAEERAQVLKDNIINIDWCDVLLCWVGGMGGFTDPGVVWEMGYACKAGKFQLAYVDEVMDQDRRGMNLMLAGTLDAITYSSAQLNAALGELSRDSGQKRYKRYELVRSSFAVSSLGSELDPVV